MNSPTKSLLAFPCANKFVRGVGDIVCSELRPRSSSSNVKSAKLSQPLHRRRIEGNHQRALNGAELPAQSLNHRRRGMFIALALCRTASRLLKTIAAIRCVRRKCLKPATRKRARNFRNMRKLSSTLPQMSVVYSSEAPCGACTMQHDVALIVFRNKRARHFVGKSSRSIPVPRRKPRALPSASR